MEGQSIFSEDNGSPSMMRWLSLLSLLNAMGLSWYSLISGKGDIVLISSFLGIAFGGKWAQKFIEENKSDVPCKEPENAKQ